jgi:hypothetical protein
MPAAAHPVAVAAAVDMPAAAHPEVVAAVDMRAAADIGKQ